MTDTAVEPATTEVDQWLSRFDEALTAGDSAAAAELFARRELLARPRRVHLEHQDRRGAGGRPGHARRTRSRAREAARLARRPSRRPRPTGVTEAWIEFETEVGRGRGHLRLRGRQGVDAADHAGRAQGPRGADGRRPPEGRRARRRPGAQDVAGAARAGGARSSATRPQPYVRDRRRRPGRHRARRAAAPARRADDHRRAQRAPRRLLAQALQVALPARPGLVRPPALHQVPRELAGVLAEGQDRRLARDVHAGDGAQLLGLDRGQERHATTRTPASGRRASSATAQTITLRPKQLVLATGMSGKPNVPEIPGHGRLQGRPAPLVPAPRPGRVRGQEGRRDRLQQLRARHLRGAVGGRRGRDDGAALLDAHRALGHADGHRARRALLRGGGRRRHDHREGRPDLRLAALPDHARVPDPALRRRCASATPTSTTRLEKAGLPARLGRGRLRPVHEVPAPRLGLLHRRRRLRAGRRRRDQAEERRRSTT